MGRENYSRLGVNIVNILRLGNRRSVIDAVRLQTGEDISNSYMISKYKISDITILGGDVNPFPLIVVSKNGLKKFIKIGERHE